MGLGIRGLGHSEFPVNAGTTHFRLSGVHLTWPIAKAAPSCKFAVVTPAEGWGNVETRVKVNNAAVLVSDVYVRCLAI